MPSSVVVVRPINKPRSLVDAIQQTTIVKHRSTNVHQPKKSSLSNNSNVISWNLPAAHTEDPPADVQCTYSRDLPILMIHNAISVRFGWFRGRIPLMNIELKTERSKLDFKFNTLIDLNKIKNTIKKLEKDIKEYEDGTAWKHYVDRVKPILEAYQPLMSAEVKGVITIKKSSENKKEDPELVTKRIDLIQKYLDIAREYINLDILWEPVTKSTCPGCNIPFEDVFLDVEQGQHVCECGYTRDNFSRYSGYKDSARVNAGGRNGYEDRETFSKAIDHFEGKYRGEIPDKLYDQLDAYYESKGFPKGEVVKGWKLLPNGRKEKTSVELLIEGLKLTNNALYYTAYMAIAHSYWGWRLHDLSSVRDEVLIDYDLTQEVYNIIKEREASLNVNIRLYLHLKAKDYPCELADFKIVTSRDSLIYHQKMWKIMCERTGVKFTSLI